MPSARRVVAREGAGADGSHGAWIIPTAGSLSRRHASWHVTLCLNVAARLATRCVPSGIARVALAAESLAGPAALEPSAQAAVLEPSPPRSNGRRAPPSSARGRRSQRRPR